MDRILYIYIYMYLWIRIYLYMHTISHISIYGKMVLEEQKTT